VAGIGPQLTADSATPSLFTVAVTGLCWLTENTFEIRFERPNRFDFLPGQKISFIEGGLRRDYTLLGPATAKELALCVRHVPNGRFSPKLARARRGDRFQISVPFGYFTFKASSRPAVFVATGTGIAPFVAYVHAGARGFDLLHGVRTRAALYYRDILAGAAHRYIPCLTGGPCDEPWPRAFAGRVDQCLATHYPLEEYDFYLCGRNEMIRDATRLIDMRFPGSRVFTEAFD
jgi:benzoate/toluate 1,2-dioxygenase reductase subunit